jgi:uncharacterized protein (DUF58 family)
MDSSSLLHKIRTIEIKARGLSKQLFMGSYQSAFKGVGMTFAEVRNYQVGDETRTIDWNVTARFNEPFVKTFEEEREQTIILLIDVSASVGIGTDQVSKREYLAEIAAVIAYSAIQNNDKVGVLFFADGIEKFIPPKKGKSHVMRIIKGLIEQEAIGKGTDLSKALEFFNNAQKKRATVFLMSDFISDSDYQKMLRITGYKHDLIGLRVLSHYEGILPKIGWVNAVGVEKGEEQLINTNSVKVRNRFESAFTKHTQFFEDASRSAKMDVSNLTVGQDYIVPLMNIFKRRG